MSLTLSCPMVLDLFPLDTQFCYLRVASCEYSYKHQFTTEENARKLCSVLRLKKWEKIKCNY